MPKDYLAQYKAGKADSERKIKEKAAYATAIAEALGHYTPELEQMALSPLGQNPTVAERMFGAKAEPFQLTGQGGGGQDDVMSMIKRLQGEQEGIGTELTSPLTGRGRGRPGLKTNRDWELQKAMVDYSIKQSPSWKDKQEIDLKKQRQQYEQSYYEALGDQARTRAKEKQLPTEASNFANAMNAYMEKNPGSNEFDAWKAVTSLIKKSGQTASNLGKMTQEYNDAHPDQEPIDGIQFLRLEKLAEEDIDQAALEIVQGNIKYQTSQDASERKRILDSTKLDLQLLRAGIYEDEIQKAMEGLQAKGYTNITREETARKLLAYQERVKKQREKQKKAEAGPAKPAKPKEK